jgi:hypothetical protein
MNQLQVVASPVWVRKKGYTNCPETVSFHGAVPSPIEAYEKKYRPPMYSKDRNTTTNYFFCKVHSTIEDFKELIPKLRARGYQIDDSNWDKVVKLVSS